MKRKIIVTYENSNSDKKQRTISYANPNASDNDLLQFTNDTFANLTNNTLIKTEKVDTTQLEDF